MDRSSQRCALGQKFPIGTFYDARNDSFFNSGLLQPKLPSDAIEISNLRTWNAQVGYDDAYDKQFEVMDISAGLGASILAGLTPLKGSSTFLKEGPKSRTLHASLHHKITTVSETLNFRCNKLKDCLPVEKISGSPATHIVCKIEWGARSIIAARLHLEKSSRLDMAKREFQSKFSTFVSAIKTSQGSESYQASKETIGQMEESLEITAFSDILEEDGIIMENFDEAFEFLTLMPSNVKDENGGTGVPIMYSLLPVEMLEWLLPDLKMSRHPRCLSIPGNSLASIIQLFGDFRVCERSLDDLERNVLANERYLPPHLPQVLTERKHKLHALVKRLQTNLGPALEATRSGSDPEAVLQVLLQFQQGDASPRNLLNMGPTFRRMIEFISKAMSGGASYVGHNGLKLHNVVPDDANIDVYILFFSPSMMKDDDVWPANCDLFFELLRNRDPAGSLFVIADCEATSTALEKVHIAQFQRGQEITSDYLEYRRFMADKCFAECNEQALETGMQIPIKRSHVNIPCPGPRCTKAEVREWICPRCVAPIQYGFADRYIYCDCGRSLFSNYMFKCNGDHHGPQPTSYDKDRLLLLLKGLQPSNYLNILILGETGVGKSTFINALVNYLEFKTLDDAMAADRLNYVIPCSFATQVMDRTNPQQPIKEHLIKVGERDDERDGSMGDSATQRTTVYPVTFNMGASILTVRLIDTPGMGDTRGVDVDKKNMADVLDTLSGYEEVHGILILLKSNAARMTVTFTYCIEELLTHLHQNAAKSMAFGFTNTRISGYTPGDTYGPLTKLLREHPQIGVTLSIPTTYCFDSESFRYLAAHKSGVTLENKEDYDRSWDHSRRESVRLIEHFKGNPPHQVKSTLSLNGARQIISELTKPLADISQAIRGSIALTEETMQRLKDDRLSGDQLRNQLFIQKVQLDTVTLDRPRTVCGNGDCMEARNDGKGPNTTVTLYKAQCHPVCYLNDVPVNQPSPPGLIKCAAFRGSENCRKCGHSYQQHLHVLYELIEETVTVIDPAIQQKLQTHASDLALRQTALAQHEQRAKEYKQEQETFREAAAKFAVFLGKYSLAPYNNALIAYLDYLIKDEQMKVSVGGSNTRLWSLSEERHKHTQAIEVIKENMNKKANWSDLTEGGIERIVQGLYGLKHFGQTLQNMKMGVERAHQATNREIPYTCGRTNLRRRPVGGMGAGGARTGGEALASGGVAVGGGQGQRTLLKAGSGGSRVSVQMQGGRLVQQQPRSTGSSNPLQNAFKKLGF
jgi:GTPase SAR1 family protein